MKSWRESLLTDPSLGRAGPKHYFFSSLIAVTFLGLQLILNPWVTSLVFILLYPAVFLSSWLWGAGPGILCTALCALGARYWFIDPKHSLAIANSGAEIRWLFFVITSALISNLNGRALQAKIRERAIALDLEGIFKVAGVGLAQTDVKTMNFLRINEQMSQLTGYTREELEHLNFIDITHPEDRARSQRGFNDLIEGRTQTYSDEKRYIRKNGEVFWAHLTLTGVRGPSGRILHTISAIQDISERVKLLQQQQIIQEELKTAVQIRDEFLSIASHELKTPITSLHLQLQMAQKSVSNLSSAEVRSPEPSDPNSSGAVSTLARLVRSLDIALRQVRRLTTLIEELLDVARIEAGKLSYNLEPLQLDLLVRETVDRLGEQFEQAGSHVDLKILAPARIRGDRFRLEQAITNLLTNALKYGAGKPVQVEVSVHGNEAELTVRDLGIGIAEKDQAKIFDRFERAISSRNISGLGLGLYITREIVSGHHGKIHVKSEPNQGSVFTIELPLEG